MTELGRAGFQQLILWGVFWPVIAGLTRQESLSVVVVAGLFGAAHLPNFLLAGGTFLVGALWIWLYRRGVPVYALILSHLLLAGTAFAFFPERTLRGLHVGAKAVERKSRYEVYANEEVVSNLRRVCAPDSNPSVPAADIPVAALLEEILGRPATLGEIQKWNYRERHLSRCAAAKNLLMFSK